MMTKKEALKNLRKLAKKAMDLPDDKMNQAVIEAELVQLIIMLDAILNNEEEK